MFLKKKNKITPMDTKIVSHSNGNISEPVEDILGEHGENIAATKSYFPDLNDEKLETDLVLKADEASIEAQSIREEEEKAERMRKQSFHISQKNFSLENFDFFKNYLKIIWL